MLAMLTAPLGIFSGLITPVQTAVNTRLGRSIGSRIVGFVQRGAACHAHVDSCGRPVSAGSRFRAPWPMVDVAGWRLRRHISHRQRAASAQARKLENRDHAGYGADHHGIAYRHVRLVRHATPANRPAAYRRHRIGLGRFSDCRRRSETTQPCQRCRHRPGLWQNQ